MEKDSNTGKRTNTGKEISSETSGITSKERVEALKKEFESLVGELNHGDTEKFFEELSEIKNSQLEISIRHDQQAEKTAQELLDDYDNLSPEQQEAIYNLYLEKEPEEEPREPLPKPPPEPIAPLKVKYKRTLEAEGVSPELSDKLSTEFAIKTQAIKENISSKVNLPHKPPKLWKDRGGLTALQFLDEHYKLWLDAEVLTWKWINEHDPKFGKALSAAISRNKNLRVKLPLTESDVINRDHEMLTGLIGQELIDRAYSIKSALITRNKRAHSSKNTLNTKPENTK